MKEEDEGKMGCVGEVRKTSIAHPPHRHQSKGRGVVHCGVEGNGGDLMPVGKLRKEC